MFAPSITDISRLQSSSAAALVLTARFMDLLSLGASEQRMKTWPQSLSWRQTMKKRMMTKRPLGGMAGRGIRISVLKDYACCGRFPANMNLAVGFY